jgi:hypothetical protein
VYAYHSARCQVNAPRVLGVTLIKLKYADAARREFDEAHRLVTPKGNSSQ